MSDTVRIGPSFVDEIAAAGLTGLPFAWSPDGSMTFDPSLTTVQAQAVRDLLVRHDPTKDTLATALAKLGEMLLQKEMAGVYFTPTGASQALLFPTDANAQIKYTAEWNMIGATPPLRTDGDPMIAVDGTPVALSNTDAKALVEKALAYIKGCAAHYATLQPLVLADPSTDVSTGWPANT